MRQDPVDKVIKHSQVIKLALGFCACLVAAGWTASHYLSKFAHADEVISQTSRITILEEQQKNIINRLEELKKTTDKILFFQLRMRER